MVLKALEIQGFKSFPDKTKVPFNKGITAVVGPNGSGKSNISDAIRWVLGETSSKQLRGGGKMEDVIFSGTQLRSAMGFASVSLVLDNSDHRLDIESDEVIIGRKYYRSGESEYSVNGQNVRLKDIYELFLDTGLGRDGYSIIGQGKIAEIVGSKSGERREIFEEASGISKYRYRKNEAEHKLAASEENLVRLRDILNELEQRVGPLEKESKKAKSYLELSEQKQDLEVTLWVDTIRKAKETVRSQQRKAELAQGDYDRDTTRMQQLEGEMEAVRLEGERLILDIENCNNEIMQINEEIAAGDAQIAVLKNDILHNDASIKAILDEIAQSGKAGGEIDDKIAEFNKLIEECNAKILADTVEIEKMEKLLDDISNKSQQTGERRGVITVELSKMTQKATELKVDAAFAESTTQSSTTRLEIASTEASSADSKMQELKDEKEDTEKFFASLTEKLTQLSNIKDGLSYKLESRLQQKQKADETAQGVSRTLENATQRLGVLKDLERSMEGYQNSVKSVIKAADNHRLRGIIGTVASILSVTSGYEMAIETALGFAMQNVVVQDETAAKAAMAMLKQDNAGRATFLPLDTVKGSTLDAKLSGSAKGAASLVQYDAKYQNIVTNMLGRIVIVDDINEASYIAKQNNFRVKIVTRDGQVINAGGSFTGGSVARSAGVFSRKQEIDELKAKIITLGEEQKTAAEQCTKIKAETDKLSAEVSATESEIITLNGDKIRCEVELSRITQNYEQHIANTNALKAECEQLKTAIAEFGEKRKTALCESDKLASDIEKLEKELMGIDGNDDSFIQTRTRLSGELGELKLSVLSLQKDADMHRQSIENLTSRTGEAEAHTQAQQENIARFNGLNAENNGKIAELEKAKQDKKAAIEQTQQKINDIRANRMTKEKGIADKKEESKTLTQHREEMGREIARLTERKAAEEAEFDQTVAKLWEEYHLTVSDAEGKCIDFDNPTELKRRVNEVRGKLKALGNVNVNAIEEFAEVGERYTFMKTQVADVETAKAQLLKMINELCAEMRDIFSENFVQINKHFGRIFSELFGGGTASLTLSEPDNLLESGIEIEVAPPGKVIKNLTSLSGGEQALVAISIYFAILAVNPAPFCILDEIEAALDDVNVTRYAQYLRRITEHTQFIVITHRRGTMEEADVLYGVTMQEDGVSKLLKLDANNVDVNMVS